MALSMHVPRVRVGTLAYLARQAGVAGNTSLSRSTAVLTKIAVRQCPLPGPGVNVCTPSHTGGGASSRRARNAIPCHAPPASR